MCFLVYEFVTGTTLAERLEAGPLPHREAAELIALVAEALAYAHGRGVIHRDIKPSNVLIDEGGRPHLTDFGLAHRDAGDPATVVVTLDGDLIGTPAYMSPEQARGESKRIDGRSDVYSLGVVLYETLTGERPFRGSPQALLRQILEEEPRPPRRWNDRIPRDLETVCLKCLEKEPSRRYPDAAALAADLRRFLAGEPVQARTVGPLGRGWRWCRRKPLVAALLAALVVAVASGFAGITAQWRRAERGWSRAEANAKLAREGRAEAEKNFRLARQTVDDYLMTVSNHAMLRRDLPGLKGFRAELLTKARDYYRGFLRAHGADPGLRADAANAYYNLGVVSRDSGSASEAEQAYRSALTIAEEIARDNPSDLGARRRVCRNLINLGNIQLTTGQRADAEKCFVRAVHVLDELTTSEPSDEESLNSLAATCLNLGALRFDAGRLAEAEQEFGRAREISLAMLSTNRNEAPSARVGADANRRRVLAQAANSLATALVFNGRPADAERLYTEAIDAIRKNVASEPHDTADLHRLGPYCTNLGQLMLDTGRPAEAERRFVEAIDAIRKAVALEPGTRAFGDALANGLIGLGDLQKNSGRAAEAERSILEALDIRRRYVAAEPRDTMSLEGLAMAWGRLGILREDASRFPEAEQNYAEARDLWDRLARSEPEVVGHRLGLAIELRNIGNVMNRTGRSGEAVPLLDRAVDLGRAVLAKEPRSAENRRQLGIFYSTLAEAQRHMSRPGAAATAARELLKLTPDDPIALYNAACGLCLCIPLVGRGQNARYEAEKAERPAYAEEALGLLRQAIARGFTNTVLLETDHDLDAIRPDPRFQAIVSEALDRAFPADPFAPGSADKR
jgi:tetratricopeptide (TPR) repeat protein